ncbi:glycosyltransferase family 2 protein [Cupriavidus oxalaticus]|uniref:Glycosyl transferase family 2 n=1 Tax=Cupriavidus oxalaticus TaxID=96344 RepID=A0A375FT99_9BURK|nr:glycosyltransferase family 2 protein [Cupriavidus oxalaticus]QRQ88153.1 glycosyltransferase family 2 protein [Cupriavidus oxalaticus]QRQ93521.1 glycosyltransferase family 2 protein [Cupriavidus oxalaticus]WQD82149.1 glycosyltransferase family 2 protein [Cupriavidus oxalaticus]SPC08544.1 Glycosyl transferase family 2 [Cupriavidus oxalaticus]SPC14275.1 Glycosyl transferase family 2 [Cupriavidus oxalaticus]
MTTANIESLGPVLPLVTVIIPCYNQGVYLRDALYSIEGAYSGPLELIVVDDGSTDARTKRELENLRSERSILRVVRKENGGLSSARNTGLQHATGSYVQFLDADDLLVPNKIDRQLDHFAIAPGLDVSVSDYMLCDDTRISCSNVESAISTSAFELSDFLFRWERGLSIPIHCGLFRREALNHLRFDETLRAKEDWVFWSMLKLRGSKMAYFPLRGAVYRQHAQSMRRSYLRMGDSWLCAAGKIRALMPPGLYPSFMDTAIAWHAECYRKHPSYMEELSSATVLGTANASSTGSGAGVPQIVDDEPSAKLAELAAKFAALPALAGAPLISVIIPIYNHYQYLIECLSSVASQDAASFEVVCIDDASTDPRVAQLLALVEKTSTRLRVLRREQNCGISANQNEAVAHARGEYLAFLDCDDVLPSQALSEMTMQIRDYPAVDYFFSDRIDIDSNGEILRHALYGGYENIVYSDKNDLRSDLLDGMVASHLKVIRKSVYLKVGGTSDQFSGIQDWELALRIADFGRFRYVNKPLYHHRIHAQSVSRADSGRQFEKTNILRRQYQLKWLNSGGRQGRLNAEDILFEDGALPTLRELKKLWIEGRKCRVVLERNCSPSVLNFLREFNSYFESVTYKDISCWVALMGYVWGNILIPENSSFGFHIEHQMKH